MPDRDKSGIYVIEHGDSGRFYIGSSVRVYARWYGHRRALQQGKHHSAYLQNAWNKYGPEAFDFRLLEECAPDKDVRLRLEQEYIDAFRPEFNVCPLARSRAGSTVSAETKERIRRTLTGYKRPLKTHCLRGHAYDDENTRYMGPLRMCRGCARDRASEKRRANGVPVKIGKTACVNGHSYTGRDFDAKGTRSCKTCARDRVSAKRRAAGIPPKMGRDACYRGHPYTEHDYDSGGRRSCRTCQRERNAARYEAKLRAEGRRRVRGASLCKHGHVYTKRDYDALGKRDCKTCRNERRRKG